MADLDVYIPLPRELREHPAARTQRTSLLKKFQDTFSVFWGKVKEGSAYTPTRWGIFDYLTLGIPRLLMNILKGAVKFLLSFNNPALEIVSYVPYGLAHIVGLVSLAVRYLTAAVATVLFSPVVLITHLISRLVGSENNDKALKLKGAYIQTNVVGRNRQDIRREISLGDYLTQYNISEDELRLTKVSERGNQTDTRRFAFSFSAKEPEGPRRRYRTDIPSFDFEIPAPPKFQTQAQYAEYQQQQQPRPAIDNGQAASIKALLSLNMFKTVSRLSDPRISESLTDLTKVRIDGIRVDEVTDALEEAAGTRSIPSLRA